MKPCKCTRRHVRHAIRKRLAGWECAPRQRAVRVVLDNVHCVFGVVAAVAVVAVDWRMRRTEREQISHVHGDRSVPVQSSGFPLSSRAFESQQFERASSIGKPGNLCRDRESGHPISYDRIIGIPTVCRTSVRTAVAGAIVLICRAHSLSRAAVYEVTPLPLCCCTREPLWIEGLLSVLRPEAQYFSPAIGDCVSTVSKQRKHKD